MNLFQAVVIAIVEGLTEYLPISSTAHMIFISSLFGIQNDEFVKMYQVSIQLGAILAVVVVYYQKFINIKSLNFYFKLIVAIIPALVLGYLFDDKIDEIMGNPLPIAVVLVIGGVILMFVDKLFTKKFIDKEENVTVKSSLIIGFWQCLAMMPGTSRSAASIIGGMQQNLNRKLAAEFSFFLAVPTMLAVSVYSIFLKHWNYNGIEVKGYEMIISNLNNTILFVLGNVIAFIVALFTIKFFVSYVQKNTFKSFGWYRIVVGIFLIIIFWNK